MEILPSRPTLYGSFGMVAASDWIAASSGISILESGGNAFDAAVAAGFVLQVVEPHMSGPGGEMVALFACGGDGRPRVLCGQGTAPNAASTACYKGMGLAAVPGSGPLAASVPGAFDAWLLLLRDYGTKTLRDVLDKAIGYAEYGCPVLPGFHRRLIQVERLFHEFWPTSAGVYLPSGRIPSPFSTHRNPALARTYRRILREAEAASGDRAGQIDVARRVWSQGFVAEAIDAFAREPHADISGELHAGVISGDDLAAYTATYEDPVTLDWRGWTLCKPGPWSQGPVFLQHLALLGDDDLAASEELTTSAGSRVRRDGKAGLRGPRRLLR